MSLPINEFIVLFSEEQMIEQAILSPPKRKEEINTPSFDHKFPEIKLSD
jgi:hypothetical protein